MRRESRIKAMQILYTIDFNKSDLDAELKALEAENLAEEVITLSTNCYNNLAKIDEYIASSLDNYTIDRLNLVDKAIIRVAVAEMLLDERRSLIINEALEITKEYSDQGDHKATSFNNRLLDKISKKI